MAFTNARVTISRVSASSGDDYICVSVDDAVKLSRVFSTTPDFWTNLQNEYDKRKESEK
jgi:plasmid maintenance system antidote protein VapI